MSLFGLPNFCRKTVCLLSLTAVYEICKLLTEVRVQLARANVLSMEAFYSLYLPGPVGLYYYIVELFSIT